MAQLAAFIVTEDDTFRNQMAACCGPARFRSASSTNGSRATTSRRRTGHRRHPRRRDVGDVDIERLRGSSPALAIFAVALTADPS
jgi:hypothetical protein